MSVSRVRRDGSPWLPIGIVVLFLASGAVSAPPVHSGSSPDRALGEARSLGAGPVGPAAAAPINSTLTVNSSSLNLSNQFWGTTVNNEVRMFRGETDAVNATPAKVLVWPGAMAGEDYDPLANIHYNTYNGTPTRALTNEKQFVEMCKAIHCIAIVQVPAEIDNPSFAERIVNYTEVNLSFVPAYWMIGNEPELWEHWKVPWKDWATQYTTGPTPTQFGNQVLAYVSAIRAVDNSTPILGLPASGCTCGFWTFDQWIAGVLKVTGDKIQAVAFHEYPAGWLGTGDGSLTAFYQTIQSAAGIPTRMVAARAAVTSACPGCNVSVLISELGAALSWSAYGAYAIGFSGSLSIASQLTQAMDDNLTNVDLFAAELATTNSWFDPTGHARADYTLYTGILDHLGTEAFPVDLSGLSHTLYAIDTIAPNDQGRRDLLVMNDNITHSIQFTPQFAGAASNAPVEAWSWNGSIHRTTSNATTWVEPFTPNPIPHEFSDGLPGTYVLPPQSLVLFESYPSGGTYVRVLENGVPSPTPWYASVGSQFYSTTAGNLSLLLPAGSYPVGSVGIPLPLGGRERFPAERLGPSFPPTVMVNGPYTNFTVTFAPQWRTDVFPTPAEGGTVSPAVGWWNESQPLNLTATPAIGYAFAGWSGWGPGSFNGTNRSITLVPTGRLHEKARFVVGQEVDLWESGLPTGTPWSITIRGFTTHSTSRSIVVYEPPGTFGFSVSPVPDYRSLPANGGFTVGGSTSFVDVQFLAITPPGPTFPVIFRISGLPSSTWVAITVRGATQTSGLGDPRFQLGTGSYAYQVGYIDGYHANVTGKTFNVTGGPLTIEVPFVRTIYPVSWVALGERTGMNWSILLNGRPIPSTTEWLSTGLPNGSYSYVAEPPANFSVTPRMGILVVSGFATKLYLFFNLVVFPTWFEATGPGASAAWSVRLGNLTQGASAHQSIFMAANGTYTFTVHPPPGFYAVPSHGTFIVSGPSSPVQVEFHPSSIRPSAELVAALSAGALSTSIWIGVAVFGGYAAFRGLRRRSG